MSNIDIIRAASGFAGRMAAATRRRRTMRSLENLPSHLLRDIGFVRDWRGTVKELRPDPKW